MEWSLGQGAALLLMGWVRIAQGSSLHPEHHLDIFGMLCLCPQLDQWFKAEFTRTEVSKRHEVAFLHVEVISLHGCVCPGLTHILWPAMVHALRSITWGHVPWGCPLWKGQIALGFGAEKFVNHQRSNLAFAEFCLCPPSLLQPPVPMTWLVGTPQPGSPRAEIEPGDVLHPWQGSFLSISLLPSKHPCQNSLFHSRTKLPEYIWKLYGTIRVIRI